MAHGQPVYHNARLFTHCRQDSLAQTTYNESIGTNIKYLTALEETKKVTDLQSSHLILMGFQ